MRRFALVGLFLMYTACGGKTDGGTEDGGSVADGGGANDYFGRWTGISKNQSDRMMSHKTLRAEVSAEGLSGFYVEVKGAGQVSVFGRYVLKVGARWIIRDQVGRDLVPAEIEVDPTRGFAADATAEQLDVEPTRRRDVGDGEGEVERAHQSSINQRPNAEPRAASAAPTTADAISPSVARA